MEQDKLLELIEKYKQELLDIAKMSTNINDTEYQDEPVESETIVEGQVLYPNVDDIGDRTVDNEILQMADSLENQVQDYLTFLKENPKQGTLKIQATTARETMPVSGVLIEVSKDFNGTKKLFYSLKTDQNGIVDGILLPAPDKKMSQTPSEKPPFSTYDIRAEHPGYIQENYINVPIFEGIKSIQPVRLKPIIDRNF